MFAMSKRHISNLQQLTTHMETGPLTKCYYKKINKKYLMLYILPYFEVLELIY